MNKKWRSTFILAILMMALISCVCSMTLLKSNLENALAKHEFESIYLDTSIDYIIPSPTTQQIAEIESNEANGIKAITPYYESKMDVSCNGKSVKSSVILLPDVSKLGYTPYSAARIISNKEKLGGGDAVIDKAYSEKSGIKIGDVVSVSIAEENYTYTVKAIAETNTYYQDGTILLVLTGNQASLFEENGLKYSAAYVSASDRSKCEQYLYTEYKPLGRMKDRSEFDSEETYQQHVLNFNDADWTKEITDCSKNYETTSVKYTNVEAGSYINIAIISVIAFVMMLVFNIIALKRDENMKFMRNFIIKKSGTKQEIKAFYKKGIRATGFSYIVVSIVVYALLVYMMKVQPLNMQILGVIIPTSLVCIAGLFLAGHVDSFVEKNYTIKKKPNQGEQEALKDENLH